ncbi:MAG TPA: hypothetical protein DCM68_05090 [Verrucomicrobia bacterium]|nr:hypothetical protein [Verrucomicrobiota bacterium]
MQDAIVPFPVAATELGVRSNAAVRLYIREGLLVPARLPNRIRARGVTRRSLDRLIALATSPRKNPVVNNTLAEVRHA